MRPELYLKQNFRAPVEETEHYAVDGHMHAHPQMMYAMQNSPYGGMRPGQYLSPSQYQSAYAMPTTSANPYGNVSGTAWPTQQATAGAPAYGNSQPYPPHGYPSYYKSSTPTTKTEDGGSTSSVPYGSQYAPAYPPMQRNGSQSTPSMAGSTYPTPVQPQSSTFGSMSARPSYGGSTIASPTTNGQSHSAYGSAPAQQYPVRSPSQSYPIQSAPNSAIAQSPHAGVKSPNSAAPASAPAADMSYRSSSYSGPPAHTVGDVSGLGISSTSGYPSQPPPHTSYSAYSGSGQTYRGGELPTAPAGGQYAAQ